METHLLNLCFLTTAALCGLVSTTTTPGQNQHQHVTDNNNIYVKQLEQSMTEMTNRTIWHCEQNDHNYWTHGSTIPMHQLEHDENFRTGRETMIQAC